MTALTHSHPILGETLKEPVRGIFNTRNSADHHRGTAEQGLVLLPEVGGRLKAIRVVLDGDR